jgi:hypothetical protein
MHQARRRLTSVLTSTVVALAGLAVFAGAAAAAVTTSKITSVQRAGQNQGHPFYYIWDADLSTQPSITVKGQTDGTTGDAVDLDCVYSSSGSKSNDSTLTTNVPVQANGSFSTTFPLANADWTCRLVALPAGTTTSDLYSLDLSKFHGPLAGIGYESTRRQAGKVYDYDSDIAQIDVWNEIQSPSNGGLCSSYLTGANQNTTYSGYSSWGNYSGACSGAAALYGDDGQSRSEIQVNGRNGYLAYWAATGGTGDTSNALYNGSETAANRSDIALTRALNHTNGNETITDTENIVECTASPDPYPANSRNCGGTKASGLKLTRMAQTSASGQQVTISDRYTSVDGKAHKLDVEYDNNTSEYEQYYTEWKLPGTGAFTYEPQGSSAHLGTSSVGTVYIEGGYTHYFDPDYNVPAAMTYTTEPSWARFIFQPVNGWYTSCADSTSYPACDLVLDYQRTVPAGGSLTITHVYTTAQSDSNVDSLAALSEDSALTPVVKIGRPANHATVSHARVRVTGKATDRHGLRSLRVDGIRVVTDASGHWSVEVALHRGANTITAVATNLAGRTAQAQDHVTYAKKQHG